ncbi:hypothetical protein [Limnobaculum xujianqingii]|uniref:hypothetical protein n=1 Tax=Limnobaculum xujianqingii TaxID=2738837 RepID=UPI00112BB576|nr:hypothetical protein [Limnobaculum xujianqingii]
MKKLFLLLALTGLVGCQTVTDMRTQGPYAEYSSAKDAKSLATCIMAGWEKEPLVIGQAFDAAINLIDGGYSVYTPNYAEVADVYEAKNGSLIKYYLQRGGAMTTQSRIDKRTNTVTSCL